MRQPVKVTASKSNKRAQNRIGLRNIEGFLAKRNVNGVTHAELESRWGSLSSFLGILTIRTSCPRSNRLVKRVQNAGHPTGALARIDELNEFGLPMARQAGVRGASICRSKRKAAERSAAIQSRRCVKCGGSFGITFRGLWCQKKRVAA